MNASSICSIKKISFLGICLYQKETNLRDDSSKTIFYGLLREQKFYSDDFTEFKHQLFICGILIYQKHIKNNNIRFELTPLLLCYKTINLSSQLLNFLNQLPTEFIPTSVSRFKHVFILHGNSGDIALFLHLFFSKFTNQKGIKQPKELLILYTKKYHLPILKLLQPHFKSIQVDIKLVNRINSVLILNDWKIYTCHPTSFYRKCQLNFLLESPGNFTHWVSDELGITPCKNHSPISSLSLAGISHQLKSKLSSEQISALNNPSGSRLIILSTQANTLQSLDNTTSIFLIELIKDAGFIPFINSDNPKDKSFLTHEEIFALSKYSRVLIAVRSGLVDFLSLSGVPIVAIYSKPLIKSASIKKCMEAFSLKPFTHQPILEMSIDSIQTESDKISSFIKSV